MTAAIEPPATLGVLGGGQLGRYFVMAARTMGFRTMVLEPDPSGPAGAVADVHLVAPYDDRSALDRLATECAVVTTEFENPPADALARLAAHTTVRPTPRAIAIAQDRRREKQFLADAGFPTAPFAIIERLADLRAVAVTGPAILKTARLGYDGKGQVGVADVAGREAAWERLGRVPCVLEQRLGLDAEISVVLARGVDGRVAPFAPTLNAHLDGILELSVAPFDGTLGDDAIEMSAAIAAALDYVGVLAVEFFVADGRLVVNELAPRPHNSGHWTLDGARTSQFEQQVRAVCGLALGDPSLTTGGVAMVNLLGDRWTSGEPEWAEMLATPGAHLHLYGKREPRRGRKMGHLTITAASGDAAVAAAQRWRVQSS